MGLFNYLEFTGIDDPAAPVAKLVDVYTAVKIGKRDIDLRSYRFKFQYFFTNEIVYLERKEFVKTFLEFEIDDGNSRVGVESHDLYDRISGSRYCWFLSLAG